jgi:hypothetical protein
LGIENNLLLGADDLVTMTNHQPTTSSFTSSTTSSITSLTTASSSIDSKQTKLDDVDKVKIRKLYSDMNEEKMWKLKTGTFVETNGTFRLNMQLRAVSLFLGFNVIILMTD